MDGKERGVLLCYSCKGIEDGDVERNGHQCPVCGQRLHLWHATEIAILGEMREAIEQMGSSPEELAATMRITGERYVLCKRCQEIEEEGDLECGSARVYVVSLAHIMAMNIIADRGIEENDRQRSEDGVTPPGA